VAELHLALGSREATPSYGKEAPSNVAIHDAKKGAKGSKKWQKQHPQWVTATADCDNSNEEKPTAPT
jgi:hypothetical protein